MARSDPFAPVRKGLREALYGAAMHAARADLRRLHEAQGLATAVRRLVALLAEHAALEEAAVIVELVRIAPDLACSLRADRARLAGLALQLTLRVELIEAAGEEARAAHGRRLESQLERLVAEQLRNLERVELVAARHLAAHLDPARLEERLAEAFAALAAPRRAAWLELLLPAVRRDERASVVRCLRAAAAIAQREVAPC